MTTRRILRATGMTLVAAFALVVALRPRAAAALEPSNTRVRPPNQIYIANLDGGVAAEIVQVAGNRIFVNRSDYDGTPMAHLYLDSPVSRVLVGDFAASGREHGKDQLCPILGDGSIRCYALSDDGTELWWWFTQASFVGLTEQAIVGDFDGNGADDVLVHNPATGALRMYTRQANGVFGLMSGFALGNLTGVDLVNKQLYAGEFGQAAGRSDLIVVDPANGQVSRYDSVTDNGAKTFWWAFTTYPGALSTSDRVSVANIDGSPTDGLVVRNAATGAVRLLRVQYSLGYLLPYNPNYGIGQLPVTTDAGVFVFAHLASFPGETGDSRDDALFFDTSTGQMTRIDARWSGFQYTYWWAYTRDTPTLNTGWPALQHDTWAIIACKFSDASDEPVKTSDVRDFFNGPVAQFLSDISFGKVDFTTTVAANWIAMNENSNILGKGRDQIDQPCIDASGVNAANYKGIIVLINKDVAYGAAGNSVLFDPAELNVGATGHELLHMYGQIAHTWDDSNHVVCRPTWCTNPGEYQDPYDVMSYAAAAQYTFTISALNRTDVAAWPELNAAYRNGVGWVPSGRVTTLSPGATKHTVTLTLAALERPEASGQLLIRIPFANSSAPGANYYALEYREPRQWDRNIPAATVLVRRVLDGTAYLQNWRDPAYQAGETFSNGAITVRVNAIDTTRGQATVTITY